MADDKKKSQAEERAPQHIPAREGVVSQRARLSSALAEKVTRGEEGEAKGIREELADLKPDATG